MKNYRLFISLIALPIIQITLVLIVYEFVNAKYPLSKPDISWGLTIRYAAIFFVGITVISSFANYFLGITWIVIAVCAILLIGFDLYLLNALDSRPVRIPFIIALTNISQISAIIIGHFFSRRKEIIGARSEEEIIDNVTE